MLYSVIITPFRIAFYDYEPLGWLIADTTIDVIFTIDIILNFYMAYYNKNYILILNRKKIAKDYLTSWFVIDLVFL